MIDESSYPRDDLHSGAIWLPVPLGPGRNQKKPHNFLDIAGFSAYERVRYATGCANLFFRNELSMIATLKRPLMILLICAFCLTATRIAEANVGYVPDHKAIPIIIAVVAVVAVGVYFAVHHGHSLKGCVSSNSGGMQILSEGDRRTYALTGDVSGIQAGDRVRVSGKKKKIEENRQFVVTKLPKDLGPCRPTSTSSRPLPRTFCLPNHILAFCRSRRRG